MAYASLQGILDNGRSTINTLISAVAKLGPERSRSALAAFDPKAEGTGGWYGCALARAYGAVGALYQDFNRWELETNNSNIFSFASAALGLNNEQIAAVVNAFDGRMLLQQYIDGRRILEQLLHAEADKIATPSAQTIVETTITTYEYAPTQSPDFPAQEYHTFKPIFFGNVAPLNGKELFAPAFSLGKTW